MAICRTDPCRIPPAAWSALDQGYDLVSGWAPPAPGCGAAAACSLPDRQCLIARVTGVRAHDYGWFASRLPREVVADLKPLLANCTVSCGPGLHQREARDQQGEGEPPRPPLRQQQVQASIPHLSGSDGPADGLVMKRFP